MSIDSNSSSKRLNLERATNFMRQFRDPDSRELKKLSANQFMEVWSHYDNDGNGYIEGTELDGFLKEFVSSANFTDISPDMKSQLLFLVLAAPAIFASVAVSDAKEEAGDVIVADFINAVEEAGVERSGLERNLSIGWIAAGDRLLYRNYFVKYPIYNAIQSQDVTYRGTAATRLTAIRALEVGTTQFGRATLVAGGLRSNTATIRLTSARSYGYYFSIEFWGR